MRVYKNFPDDEVLDAAIVIPSYDEGDGILPTLREWMIQMTSLEIRTALYVVVNGPQNSSREIAADNHMTASYLRCYMEVAGGEDMAGTYLPPHQQKIFNDLRREGKEIRCRIALIDLYTEGNAPEKCTVGLARDTGFREAAKQVHDEGFFIGSDADTVPHPSFLKAAHQYLEDHPQVDAFKGPVYREAIESHETKVAAWILDHIQWMEQKIRECSRLYAGERQTPFFPYLAGSNTVVRKWIYEEAGGMPHINGAEDTELSRKILWSGGQVVHLDQKELSVTTSMRASRRTDEGHGFGCALSRAYAHIDDPAHMPVLSPLATALSESILLVIQMLNTRKSSQSHIWKQDLARILHEIYKVELTAEEVSFIWEANQAAPELRTVHYNRVLLIRVNQVAATKKGTVSFADALDNLAELIASSESRLRDPIAHEAFPSVKGSGSDFLKRVQNLTQSLEDVISEREDRQLFQAIGRNAKGVLEKWPDKENETTSGVFDDVRKVQKICGTVEMLNQLFALPESEWRTPDWLRIVETIEVYCRLQEGSLEKTETCRNAVKMRLQHNLCKIARTVHRHHESVAHDRELIELVDYFQELDLFPGQKLHFAD